MSVTAAAGFVAAGIHCGVKPPPAADLALVATADGRAVPAAAVFTSNLAAAAPVLVSRRHLHDSASRAAAVVINSGNANAATGATGLEHAESTCAWVADRLGCGAEEVVVCSTGLIGIPLPIAAIEAGVGRVVEGLSPAGGADAATAIMTTDTRRKEVVVTAGSISVGGMAKGAAMLAPDMATMLAILTTDAEVGPPTLRAALGAAVADSFNALIVDGCTSTNDTVVVLASGRAGPPAPGQLEGALAEACADLAAQMAADAEGATLVARLTVRGARSPADARQAARKVAQSALVKCSLFGRDPYWGRVVSELGSSGAAFDPDRVSVAYGGTVVCRGGVAAGHDANKVRAHLRTATIELTADLGLGPYEATVLATDLGPGYIDENKGTS